MNRTTGIRFVALTLLAITALSCAYAPPPLYRIQQNELEWRYNSPHPYQNDLAVDITLNDSVFLLYDMADCFRFVDSMKTRWHYQPSKTELYGNCIIPLLSVQISHTGRDTMRVPYAGCSVLPSGRLSDIEWDLGIADSTTPLKSKKVMSDFFSYDLTTFADFNPGDRHTLADSVNLFEHYHLPSVTPGTYWVVVTVQNYRWTDWTPPVWTGRIRSDTLYFRLID